MTTTQGPKVAHRPPVALPPAMAALQKWRNADHEDHIFLTRDDVITLIEETCQQLADAEAAQAAFAERAAEIAESIHSALADAIRSIPSDTGVKALNKLRAERDMLRDALSIAGPIALEDFAGHPFCYNEEELRKIAVIRAALSHAGEAGQ